MQILIASHLFQHFMSGKTARVTIIAELKEASRAYCWKKGLSMVELSLWYRKLRYKCVLETHIRFSALRAVSLLQFWKVSELFHKIGCLTYDKHSKTIHQKAIISKLPVTEPLISLLYRSLYRRPLSRNTICHNFFIFQRPDFVVGHQ